MFIILIFTLILLIYGIFEQNSHLRKANNIPIRIHVNGTRGKSTTTRLIASGLREAGFKVLAKTTGTLPRVIFEDGTEVTIKRRGNANIIEQLQFFKEATKRKVDAIVLECMAINPELQWVSEHKMVKSTIGVITNVREDHLEEIGFGLENMANALSFTIPQEGILVTSEKKYLPLFKKRADKLKTKTIFAHPGNISNKLLEKFRYMNFKDNISMALQVNKLLGIENDIALQGILKAAPDPGALKIYELSQKGKTIIFINAFAANDLHSTLLIWKKVKKDFNLNNLMLLAIINNREDRVMRNIQFSHLLVNELRFHKILIVGSLSKLVERALLKQKISSDNILNLSKITDIDKILNLILQFTKKDKILCIGVGNTKGMGQKFIEYFSTFGEEK
jgi:poly-gamma-glutamate synthase PgsB/CapB